VTPPEGRPDPQGSEPLPLPPNRIGLSTASIYPESTAAAFGYAAELGYDAVEIMVGIDPTSQDVDGLCRLRDESQIPICAIHAPCLLITQRVWGSESWGKLQRSAETAAAVGARTVVVHPPFRWQRDYARTFEAGIARLEAETGVDFAVENMFPWRASRRELQAYLPSWSPVGQDYAHTTLDVSHAATSGTSSVAMALDLGHRLHHVHMTDGSGSAKDEHLVPGRGAQPCAELLELLARTGFAGDIVIEINTRRANGRDARRIDLVESLAFTRLHLAARAET
jgi:sugar phosphate isomerase/epimerase